MASVGVYFALRWGVAIHFLALCFSGYYLTGLECEADDIVYAWDYKAGTGIFTWEWTGDCPDLESTSSRRRLIDVSTFSGRAGVGGGRVDRYAARSEGVVSVRSG